MSIVYFFFNEARLSTDQTTNPMHRSAEKRKNTTKGTYRKEKYTS